jgi:hypothetical protein
METFYIVIRADVAQTSVSRRHETEEDARSEAERLCQQVGKPFIVLKAVACVQLDHPPVKWQEIGDGDAD